MINILSEHEECRSCLDPGLKRRCCDNYYCDECYFNQPICRYCRTPIDTKARNRIDKGRYLPIILGWALSIFVITVVIIGIALILANNFITPVGIFGYKCSGFFPTCNLNLCIAVDGNISAGTQPLSPLYSYQQCNLSSLQKIETLGCVYDSALYSGTDSMLGYDICADKFQEVNG